MADIKLYNKFLGVKDAAEIYELFTRTCLKGRPASYYVNWEKVKRQLSAYDQEIRLLGALVGSNKPLDELVTLIERYPTVLPVMPILFAITQDEVCLASGTNLANHVDIDFRPKSPHKHDEIIRIVSILKEMGFVELLSQIKQLHDYIFGVEVGLDSNARKNRGGDILEGMVTAALRQIASTKKDFKFETQKTFGWAATTYGVNIPKDYDDRKCDVVCLSKRQPLNIEVSYYSGGGSKPDAIAGDYIKRADDLRKSGWRFIWITDGERWCAPSKLLLRAIENTDYVFNMNFVNRGLLAEVL